PLNLATSNTLARNSVSPKEVVMQLGMIGLGGMGANMVRRRLRGGHQCVVFDRSAKAVEELVKEKATGAVSLAEFVKRLHKPRAVRVMVPPGGGDGTNS